MASYVQAYPFDSSVSKRAGDKHQLPQMCYTRSTIVAIPWPTPMHKDTSP